MTATLSRWYLTHPHARLTTEQAHDYLADHGHSVAAAEHFIHWRTGLSYPLTIDALSAYAGGRSTLTTSITRREVEEWVGETFRLDVIESLAWDWLVTDRLDALTRFGHAVAHGSGTISGRSEWLVAEGHNPKPPQYLRNAAN